MKRFGIHFKLFGTLLLLGLSITSIHGEQYVEIEEETCSLDPKIGDCATDEAEAPASPPEYEDVLTSANLGDLTRQVIPLTDETFDALTWTSQPSTWLIMFSSKSCGICKKATPVLESLSVDDYIIKHNDKQINIADDGADEGVAEETETDEDQTPKGPIYIATIDASNWSGRDITKRFKVDGTPHIILLRNEGYDEVVKEESRSYYVYRGQRALYPLRRFVLGEYRSRKQLEMPSPLSVEEQKKNGLVGRLYDYLLLPSVKWAGGIVGKIFIAWIVFIGLLGLFLRVHNYAWGENNDDHSNEDELEKEKAKGRAEFQEGMDEKTKRRQQIMWERKKANHEKRMKNKERGCDPIAEVGSDGSDDDDEHIQAVGMSVKKSDVFKSKAGTSQKHK